MTGGELGPVREGLLADPLPVDGDRPLVVGILQDRDRLHAIMRDRQFHMRPGEQLTACEVAA
jgi:hypothetical protein